MVNKKISPQSLDKTAASHPYVYKSNLNILRISLFVSLLFTAILGGYFSYEILNRQEERIEEISFKSTTSQIQEVSTHSITAKIKSLHSFRVFLASNCPTLDYWPNCMVDVDYYDTFATGFIVAADIDTCNHEALVKSTEIDSFVENATKFYSNSGYSDVADAVSNGIFAVNESTFELFTVDEPDGRGENRFILPILQIVHPNKNFRALMFNIYSGMTRITLIDDIYSCIRDLDGSQQAENFTINDIGQECMVVTKVIKVVEDIDFRPAVIMMYPVMLDLKNISVIPPHLMEDRITIQVNGKTYVHVGSISVIFYWDRVLTKSVSQKTDGLDILLNDGTNDYYYTFQDGTAVYVPDGSFTSSSGLQESFPITSTLSNSNFTYTLTIRADHTFSDNFYTNGPIFASALYIGAIMLCMTIYYLYDIQTTKRWAQIDLMKRNFVRYISHEIRTPLTTVNLGINFVLKRLRFLEDSSEVPVKNNSHNNDAPSFKKANEAVTDVVSVLENVEGSLDIAVLILNDLLNYDKIRNGSLELLCDHWDAWEIVDEVGKSLQVAAQAASVSLEVKSNFAKSNDSSSNGRTTVQAYDVESPEHPHFSVFGDAIKLKQVLRNLISNALKFTPEGGMVSVTCEWSNDILYPQISKCGYEESDPQGTFVINVQDNGVGLSTESLKLVFSDGWQCNPNVLQSGQGSGLGLWITKNIVEMHHGKLACHSEGLGKGCSMILELPAVLRKMDESSVHDRERKGNVSADSPSPGMRPNSWLTKSVAESHSGKGKRVLVVDDSAMCRKMVCRLLKSKSYECLEAKDGFDCINMMDSNSVKGEVDFVLLDFEMPNKNGPTACKELREKGYNLPIIGLTGNVLKTDTDYFMRCGANAVIAKPFNLDDFFEVIEGHTTQ